MFFDGRIFYQVGSTDATCRQVNVPRNQEKGWKATSATLPLHLTMIILRFARLAAHALERSLHSESLAAYAGRPDLAEGSAQLCSRGLRQATRCVLVYYHGVVLLRRLRTPTYVRCLFSRLNI
jgi:hypothetical protein